ncbi:helix-turn-helix transcriptional regulator [Streptomyces sp. NPDC002845]
MVADRDGEPRLFRSDRVLAAEVTDEPVHRRPGQDLATVWALLRERFESLPDGIRVHCRVRREQLEIFQRLFASQLVAPPLPVDDGWALAELAFRELPDVRGLLSMGATVEVLDPPEARAELTTVATELAAPLRCAGLTAPTDLPTCRPAPRKAMVCAMRPEADRVAEPGSGRSGIGDVEGRPGAVGRRAAGDG